MPDRADFKHDFVDEPMIVTPKPRAAAGLVNGGATTPPRQQAGYNDPLLRKERPLVR